MRADFFRSQLCLLAQGRKRGLGAFLRLGLLCLSIERSHRTGTKAWVGLGTAETQLDSPASLIS